MVLGFGEHLPEDEQPPMEIWMLEEELAEHFDKVKAKRREKYGQTNDEDSAEYMTNDLAEEMLRNVGVEPK